MRARKFICCGCHTSKRDAVVFQYCSDCHTNYYRINRLMSLILYRYPSLKGEWIADILIKMWRHHVKGQPEHERAATKLLNAKPEQLTLW